MKLKVRNPRISFLDHPARVVERNAEKLVADFDLFEQRMAEGRERMDIESGYTEQERLERMVYDVLGIGVNPVDPQREKVYEAEHNTHGDDDHYCEWTTFDQVAAFVREVEASAWWRSHFDNQPVPPLAIAPTSREESTTAASCAAPDLWAIKFHPALWCRSTVIHEMAHIACDHASSGKRIVAHGPKWCRCFLDGLYAHGLIDFANRLRAEFVRLGVEVA